MLSSFLLGFGSGLALIVAIGAQNAYVLRVGIAAPRRIVAPVVAICAVSDALLILVGVLGIGAVIESAPTALTVIRIVGATFLIGYGCLAAWRCLHPQALTPGGEGTPAIRLRTAMLTSIALTFLNPHVYLDTVLLLGSIVNQQPDDGRWWCAAGAMVSSCLWFTSLGFGARLLRPVFAKPAAWRVLDACIAIIMFAIGLRIAWGH